MNHFAALVSTLAMTQSVPVLGGVIVLDQPHDFVAFSPSEEGTAVPFARTADDFFVKDSWFFFMRSVTVQMIVTYPNVPDRFELEIYEGDLASHADFEFSIVEEIVDHGAWNGDETLHLLSVTFDTDFVFLQPGPYWISPFAIGNGSGTDRAWWGTAGNGEVNDSEGYFKSEHFGVPEWTPISQSGILDFPTDFAMTIEAIVPAPGVIGLLALAGLHRRRSRV